MNSVLTRPLTEVHNEKNQRHIVAKNDVHVYFLQVTAPFLDGFTLGRIHNRCEVAQGRRKFTCVEKAGVVGGGHQMLVSFKFSTSKQFVELE